MLGKLIKHEIRATARTFLPRYGAILVLAGINRLLMAIEAVNSLMNIFSVLMTVLYGLFIVIAFVLTVTVMIQRFYRNLLGDEGYLMFTLPVRPWAHIVAKGITSIIWLFLTAVATYLSACILSIGTGAQMINTGFFSDLGRALDRFGAEYGVHGGWLMAEGILGVLLALVLFILLIYASIAIGHLFRSHRVLASVGAYLVISFMLQMLLAVCMISGVEYDSTFVDWTAQQSMQFVVFFALPVVLCVEIALSAIFFIITNQIFKKRLNLE